MVRAASGVVLQRELSLSRRVYTWFLGTDDNHEAQAKYFQSHGLGILSSTLLGEMENPLEDAQRPFKVFLSLLDRWEIGAPLSERLGVPALQAIRRLSLTGRISAEEVSQEVGFADLRPRLPVRPCTTQWSRSSSGGPSSIL